MQAPEIELKFTVVDAEALRSAAFEMGFDLVTERTFESNTLYDTADRQLRARKEILRLRQYGPRCTVTHKRQSAGGDGDLRYKTRIETESVVEDGNALAEIFAQLGYGPVFRYEKFRTEWDAGPGHLVLDETPIGVWAELEGPPEWIDATLVQLCVAPELQSTESYGKLFLRWKDETGSPAENLTFDEVGTVAV
jgi:adenylate cyclase class 2